MAAGFKPQRIDEGGPPDRSQLLLAINNAIVSHLDLAALLRAVCRCLRRELPHDFAGLALYDPETRQLRMHALDFPTRQDFFETVPLIPLAGTPAGLAFTTRRPVLRHSIDRREFFADVVEHLVAQGVKSGCAVPLIAHDRALGTLGVASLREGAFTEEHAELLAQIANQVAMAVENALNFECARKAEQQLVRERDRLSLLMELSNHLASNLELRDLLRATAVSVRRIMQCDAVTVYLPDSEGVRLQAYALDFPEGARVLQDAWQPVEGTLQGRVFRTGKAVAAARINAGEYPLEAQSLAGVGLAGICSVPLVHRRRVLGNLALARREEKAWAQEEIDFLTQFGAQVAIAIENALAYGQIAEVKDKLAREKLYLEDEIRSELNFEEIIGGSAALRLVLKQVQSVAPTDSTILIRGETGTGKELIAHAIHNLSSRRERTLMKVNCAAIPTGLLESELFGHEKGAFTGAIHRRIGRFELAHGSTLFLDEVGDIPLELQPKLLRVLQENEFERLGSCRTQRVDVRLVAATNCDLEEMVAKRQFRIDLFYRLNVFPISIPPLRERPEDIPVLVRFFAQKFAKRMHKPIETVAADALAGLTRYHWPGNVRELENLVERAVILSTGCELQVPVAQLGLQPGHVMSAGGETGRTAREVEREHLLNILRETNWLVGGPKGAAARLGLKRTTLQARMRRLGIKR